MQHLTGNSVLFLDLEETVIDNWGHRQLLHSNLDFISNCIKVRNRMSKKQIVELGLFSFAIDDETDLRIFREELMEPIEQAIGLNICFHEPWCLTKEQMAKMFFEITHVKINHKLPEFNDFLGDKGMAFMRLMPELMRKDKSVDSVFLLDDTVDDFDIKFKNHGPRIHVRNITHDFKPRYTSDVVIIDKKTRDPFLLCT